MNRSELEKIVNTRQWPQAVQLACQASGITPMLLILRIAGAHKDPRSMTQEEIGVEIARLAHLKDRLSHPKRTELVERFPTQWKRATMSDKARNFAIEVIKELRQLAGE